MTPGVTDPDIVLQLVQEEKSFDGDEIINIQQHHFHRPHSRPLVDKRLHDLGRRGATETRIRELESRLSVSARVAEFLQQRLLQSEEDRQADVNRIKDLKLELLQVLEQAQAKDETIARYATQHQERNSLLENLVQQVEALQTELADDSYDAAEKAHMAERNKWKSKQEALQRQIESLESRYARLEKTSESFHSRAIHAEGAAQLADAKHRLAVTQLEQKIAETEGNVQWLQATLTKAQQDQRKKEQVAAQRSKELEASCAKSDYLEGKLEETMAAAERRIAELEELLSTQQEESDAVQRQANEADRARKSSVAQHEQLQGQWDALRDVLREKDHTIQSQQAKLKAQAREMDALRSRLLQTEDQLSLSSTTKDVLRGKVLQLEEERSLSARLTEKNEGLRAQLAELETRLKQSQTTTTEQAQRLEKAAQDIIAQKQEHGAIVDHMKSKMLRVQVENETLQLRVSDLRSKVDPLSNDLQKLTESESKLKEELSQAQTTVSRLQIEKDNLQQAVDEINQKAMEDKQELKHQLEASSDRVGKLEQQLASTEKSFKETKSKIEYQQAKAEASARSLQHQVDLMNEEKNILMQTHHATEEERDQLLTRQQREITTLSTQLRRVQDELEGEQRHLNASLNEVKSLLDQARSQSAETKMKLVESEKSRKASSLAWNLQEEDFRFQLREAEAKLVELRQHAEHLEERKRNDEYRLCALASELASVEGSRKQMHADLAVCKQASEEKVAQLQKQLQETRDELELAQHELVEKDEIIVRKQGLLLALKADLEVGRSSNENVTSKENLESGLLRHMDALEEQLRRTQEIHRSLCFAYSSQAARLEEMASLLAAQDEELNRLRLDENDEERRDITLTMPREMANSDPESIEAARDGQIPGFEEDGS